MKAAYFFLMDIEQVSRLREFHDIKCYLNFSRSFKATEMSQVSHPPFDNKNDFLIFKRQIAISFSSWLRRGIGIQYGL